MFNIFGLSVVDSKIVGSTQSSTGQHRTNASTAAVEEPVPRAEAERTSKVTSKHLSFKTGDDVWRDLASFERIPFCLSYDKT